MLNESWVKERHPKARLEWVNGKDGGWRVSLRDRRWWRWFTTRTSLYVVPTNAWLAMALQLQRPMMECSPAIPSGLPGVDGARRVY